MEWEKPEFSIKFLHIDNRLHTYSIPAHISPVHWESKDSNIKCIMCVHVSTKMAICSTKPEKEIFCRNHIWIYHDMSCMSSIISTMQFSAISAATTQNQCYHYCICRMLSSMWFFCDFVLGILLLLWEWMWVFLIARKRMLEMWLHLTTLHVGYSYCHKIDPN